MSGNEPHYPPAYIEGYRAAVWEIAAGTATDVQAKERGLYLGNQDDRIAWDCGYDAAVCAYRLGHDVEAMAAQGIYENSILNMAAVVGQLLDGTWRETRKDPRRKSE